MESINLYTDAIEEMYSKLPNLLFGFHGCSKSTFENVIVKGQALAKSNNSYDWLGNGIYFWENSYKRALDWAENKYGDEAAVLGAVIDLGHCLNLTDYASSEELRKGYALLEQWCNANGEELPVNKKPNKAGDVLLRDLDCAVIERIHKFNKEKKFPLYDSVRGAFTEGDFAFPGSAFAEKTHIQICIVNPNCIKGYFTPMISDGLYVQP